MAIITLIASGGWSIDAATIWDSGLVPAIGDVVDVTGNFDLAVDTDTNAIASFDRSGSTGLLTLESGQTLDVDGMVILEGTVDGPGTISCSDDFTINGGSTITTDLQVLMDGTGNIFDSDADARDMDLEIDTAGTVTQTFALFLEDFTMTAGTFVGTGRTLTAAGDAAYAAGTITDLSLTMPGVGKTLEWDTGSNKITLLTIPSAADISLSGNARYKAFAGSGALDLNGQAFTSSAPASDFWTFDGTVTGSGLVVLVAGTISNAAPISVGEANVTVDTSGAVLTLTCLETTGTLGVVSSAADSALTASARLSCGDITLGRSGAVAPSGILNLGGGSHKFDSITAGNPANTADALAAGTSSILMPAAGVLDGADIAVTSTSANMTNGVLTNVALTGLLNCWGVTESTGNSGDIIHHGGVETGVAIGLAV